MPWLRVAERCFLIHGDGEAAHYLEYISYLNETVGLCETRVSRQM